VLSTLKQVRIFTFLVLDYKLLKISTLFLLISCKTLLFVSNTFHEPSFEIVAIRVESQLKAKSSTPDLCPCNSKALLMAWKSPFLLKTTSQTFTSGAKPVIKICITEAALLSLLTRSSHKSATRGNTGAVIVHEICVHVGNDLTLQVPQNQVGVF